MAAEQEHGEPGPRGNRREVASLFLKLGLIAVGGPAAHVALMRRECVERLGWLSEQEFLDLFGAANLIPGPSSTELAILLGYRRAGRMALVIAGLLFILPAMILVLAAAWAYVHYGSTPTAKGLLYGVKPVIIAVVAAALYGLLRAAIKGVPHALAAAGAFVLLLAGINPLPLLLGGGALLVLLRLARRVGKADGPHAAALLPLLLARLPLHAAPAARHARNAALVAVPVVATIVLGSGAAGYTPAQLFLTFLKIGAVLYGSGYVLLAFLHNDFVVRLHWLTSQQIIDATAVGQFTPGPVFTTAAFVGYLVGGFGGGLLATLAIFLPSFVYAPLVLPLVGRSKRSPTFRAALDGVNAAALGLMAAVTLQLGQDAIVDVPSALLGLVALAVLLRWKFNSAWLVLGGAAAGLLIRAL